MAEAPFFTFRGKPIAAIEGQSVAAALIAAGVRALRETGTGGPRGVYCGMGVCQDCIVTIDGRPGQRACLTPIRRGMRVESEAAEPLPPPRIEERVLSPDLLVIGGGPGGLTVAAIAAEAGLDTVLVDDRPKLGGQYFKQPAVDDAGAAPLDRQFRAGRALIERAERAGAHILSATTVWAAFAPDEIAAIGPEASWQIRPRRLVLATGAYERGVPLPGWTLPGCMTTGAAQTFLRAYRMAPGRRVLLAGNGPLNLQVAAELTQAGAEVVALAELAPPPGLAEATTLATMLASAPGLVRDGLRYRIVLRQGNVPVFHRHVVTRVEGTRSVEHATLARIDDAGRPLSGTEHRFAVDTVCFGFGFLPSNEIARMLGCRHRFDARRAHLVAERDSRGRSSIAGVWIIGDGAGLDGAPLARAMGVIAGADVVGDLGAAIKPALMKELRAAERARARHRRFQDALWRLYRAPRIVDALADADTLVCRCEGVTHGAVSAAIDTGARGLGALKRLTRAGMGRCQGRYCASLIAEMVARRHDTTPDELAFFAPRLPFRPVPLTHIAPPEEPAG